MLVKKDVLVLNGQKLVQSMQVHKKLMLQIMSERITAHHLPWIEDFKSYQNLTSLNRRVLVELVESITVYDKEHIHIQYRFDQEIRNVLEYCSSVPAEETEESAV